MAAGITARMRIIKTSFFTSPDSARDPKASHA